MDIRELETLLGKGMDIEQVLEDLNWKDFESMCSQILEENGWKVRRNFRLSGRKRFEIDILALKGDRVLGVDCKHWKIRKGKASQIKRAAKDQKARVKELQRFKSLFGIFLGAKPKFKPVIVTLMEEDLIRTSGVWVVPVFKLNSFLLNLEDY